MGISDHRRHDLGIDHAGLAVEHAADPDLAVFVHAGGQAVAPIGAVLERDRVHRPFDGEEADRQDVDQVGAHAASFQGCECCHASIIASTGTTVPRRVERSPGAMAQ
jgi:hypothetical protein